MVITRLCALYQVADGLFCLHRPAQALTRRQWRASELRWLQERRWRPTWSLSWQLLAPRLPHTSTGEHLRHVQYMHAAAVRDLAIDLYVQTHSQVAETVLGSPNQRLEDIVV